MSKERILAVDDEKNILDILHYLLDQQGYNVDAFLKADDALEAAQSSKYDLIILDLVMGTTDGYTVAGHLKELPLQKQTPFLFVSAKIEMAELFLKNFDGRADYMGKPFKRDELLEKVKSLLAGGGAKAPE